jgi:hypothetical protein
MGPDDLARAGPFLTRLEHGGASTGDRHPDEHNAAKPRRCPGAPRRSASVLDLGVGAIVSPRQLVMPLA